MWKPWSLNVTLSPTLIVVRLLKNALMSGLYFLPNCLRCGMYFAAILLTFGGGPA